MKTNHIIFKNVITKDILYPITSNLKQSYAGCEQLAKHIFNDKKDNKHLVLYVRGSSGSVIGTILFTMLRYSYDNIEILYINKEEEKRHSNYKESSLLMETQVAIVDDFIDTGSTILEIFKKLNSHLKEMRKHYINDKYVEFLNNLEVNIYVSGIMCTQESLLNSFNDKFSSEELNKLKTIYY